jgi:hypothetical protein
MVWHCFWSQGPIGQVLVQSILMSSKMRCFFLLLDCLGTVLLVTVFFTTSGDGAQSRRSAKECSSSSDPWQSIGRIIAIALVSSVLAGMPLSILGSLHQREFKHFRFEGCPEWQAQLRAWRVQDRMIWVLGSAYGLFALHFIVLFFANVNADDQLEWIISNIVSLCEDFIVLPLLLSLVFPVLAFIFLALLSRCYKVKKAEMLKRTMSLRSNSSLHHDHSEHDHDHEDDDVLMEAERIHASDPKPVSLMHMPPPQGNQVAVINTYCADMGVCGGMRSSCFCTVDGPQHGEMQV